MRAAQDPLTGKIVVDITNPFGAVLILLRREREIGALSQIADTFGPLTGKAKNPGMAQRWGSEKLTETLTLR